MEKKSLCDPQRCNQSDQMLPKENSLNSENYARDWMFPRSFQESWPLCNCTLRGVWCIGWGSGHGGWGGRKLVRFGWEGWGWGWCRCRRRGREGIDVEVSPSATKVGAPRNHVVSIGYRLAMVCPATFRILVGCCTCTSRKGCKSWMAMAMEGENYSEVRRGMAMEFLIGHLDIGEVKCGKHGEKEGGLGRF